MMGKIALYKFILFLLILGLSGCMNKPKQLQLQSAQEIEALGKACEDLEKRQIETWDARDPEKLRDIYTEDIVHFDAYPYIDGIDQVIDMASGMFNRLKPWKMVSGETFISQEKCVGTWVNWGVRGFTRENPGLEFDLLETKDNKISFWRLFYDEKFDFYPIDYKFLAMFENAWSASDANSLVDIYSENAVLDDTLFGISVEGRDHIADYGQNFIELSQGGTWTLIQGFTERQAPIIYQEEYPFPSLGGVFSVNTTMQDGSSCELRVLVILTPDENGKIQSQETFYNANTLDECGWVKRK